MAYRFKRKESLRDGTLRIAEEQVRQVAEHLSAPTDRALHIHAARQGLKRLRALLRLTRSGLSRPLYRRANRLCRDTARAVAHARDAAVMLEAFDGLAKELLPLEAGALAALRQALAARCPKPPADEAPHEASRFIPDLLDLPRRLADADLPAHDWEPIGEGLRRCCGHGQKKMRLAFAHPSEGRFHDWRKRVKDRWHQSLLLRNCWKPIMASLTAELRRLGDLLGADHDLAVLRSLLAEGLEAELTPGMREVLLERIAARQADLRREARLLGQCLYSEKPKRSARRLGAYWKAWKKRRRPRKLEPAAAAEAVGESARSASPRG